MKTTMYTITHKTFERPSDKLYVPLQVGAALHPDLGYLSDYSGQNISAKNPYYSELTGMYWIWKNDTESDIVGICHYRRYLLNAAHKLYTQDEIERALSEVDLLISNKLELHANYYDGFAIDHNLKDLQITGEVLRQLYPEYEPYFAAAIHDNKTYFGNLIVCKKSLYDAYMSWLFSILFEVEKRVDVSTYDGYRKRLFGFLAEFLQMIYVQVNGLKVRECEVAIIGEKFETREVKNKLAEYFIQKDIQGAKNYYLKCRKERPDIIMEASDITGELRLCMQVISTCEFEQMEKGTCMIDHITEFSELMRFFRQLNLSVENPEKEESKAFLKSPLISAPMLEIAKRLL